MTINMGAQLSDREEHSSPRQIIQVLNDIRVMLPSHDEFMGMAVDN